MNKVITINLNGNAYQIEEEGYESLRAYLHQANERLHDNPDKEEIIKDFEQAIAEKCDTYLSAHKNVVTESEMKKIISDMGPVDSSGTEKSEPSSESETPHTSPAPKRLFQIREGAWISGVCNGIAAYFNVDVIIVRVLFIIFTLANGIGILLYIVMMVAVPVAKTQEQKATARGERWNAHEFFETMRSKYGKYADKDYWKKYKDNEKEYWKKFGTEEKSRWADWSYKEKNRWETVGKGFSLASRIGTGILGVTGMIILVGLGVAWIVSIWAIVVSGTLFHMEILAGASPLLLGIFVSCAFYIVSWPINMLTSLAWKHSQQQKTERHDVFKVIVSAICWGIAIALFISISVASLPRFHGGVEPYGYQFYLNHKAICIGGNGFCDPAFR